MSSQREIFSRLAMTSSEEVGLCSQRLSRIKPAMMKFVEQNQAPGFITAITRQGKLVHHETMGYMDVESQKPMQADAIFRLHSQTKPVIAVAIMQLYEQGFFTLSDPIADYLPEFRDMEVLQADGSRVPAEPITIKHLLTHTAGLSYYLHAEEPVGKLYLEAGLVTNLARLNGTTSEHYVKKIAALPLIAQPGTTWKYSEAMGVLGRLVEVVSRLTLGVYFEKNVFEPLGMVDTGFYVKPESIHRLVTQYLPKEGGGLVEAPPEDLQNKVVGPAYDYSRPPSYESGSSGLVSTMGDYLRFAQMLANNGQLDGVQLLSPTSVDAIMTNQLGPEFGDRPLAEMGAFAPSNPGIGFGFCGLVVTDIHAAGWTGSNGEYSWGGSASTDFWVDRKQALVALVMSQLVPTGCIPSRERMHQMTYQAITDLY